MKKLYLLNEGFLVNEDAEKYNLSELDIDEIENLLFYLGIEPVMVKKSDSFRDNNSAETFIYRMEDDVVLINDSNSGEFLFLDKKWEEAKYQLFSQLDYEELDELEREEDPEYLFFKDFYKRTK